MVLFQQNADPLSEVMELRNQGLTDSLIMEEMTKKGYPPRDIRQALARVEMNSDLPTAPEQGPPSSYPGSNPQSNNRPEADSNIYERIEEITENIIDEKWDELIAEVKKIITWKEKIEDRQVKINSDIEKLKEDFNVLHQGVLGKLEDYDARMRDVGTELKAVGRVFKDVVPEFVDNVKELSSVTKRMKER